MSNDFGNYTNTDERIGELKNRLAAWYICGEQLPELFAEAQRRLIAKFDDVEVPLMAPASSILEAFEEALDSFDNILAHFPEEPQDIPGLDIPGQEG